MMSCGIMEILNKSKPHIIILVLINVRNFMVRTGIRDHHGEGGQATSLMRVDQP